MSRKCNTKHNRGRSNYKARLASRGLYRAPAMRTLAELCKAHDHRAHKGVEV